MRKQDLFRLCLQNLLRKRSRTFLTVLGVVIGGCSIVIMVSLGIGMKEAQDKLLAELGDLTIITVTAPQGGRGKVKLDDALVARLKKLEGAVAVMPRQTLDTESLRLTAGSAKRYVADWVPVTGLDAAGMEAMGFKLEKGERMARPGEVVVYARNAVTNRCLEEAGIRLHTIPSAELSRGRGGPRCMSMPLWREDP